MTRHWSTRQEVVMYPAVLVLAALFAGPARGQDFYSDIWTQQNGSTVKVWAIGATDDMQHGVQHDVQVSITLSGPNGPANGYTVGSGFDSQMVSLTAQQGTYSASSSHQAGCSGWLGTSFTPAVYISIHQTTYLHSQYIWRSGPPLNQATSYYGKYCPSGGGVCGAASAIVGTGDPAPLYEKGTYMGVKIGTGSLTCLQIPPAIFTTGPASPYCY